MSGLNRKLCGRAAGALDALQLEGIVRTLVLLAVTVACFSSVTLAQSNQASPANQNYQEPKVDSQKKIVDPVITQEQINKLPVVTRGPRVTLQHALKIAESFAKREKIKLSGYFLLEVRMIQYGGERDVREARWFFRWIVAKGPLGDDVEITVSMEGKASRLPSM